MKIQYRKPEINGKKKKQSFLNWITHRRAARHLQYWMPSWDWRGVLQHTRRGMPSSNKILKCFWYKFKNSICWLVTIHGQWQPLWVMWKNFLLCLKDNVSGFRKCVVQVGSDFKNMVKNAVKEKIEFLFWGYSPAWYYLHLGCVRNR